MSKKYTGVSYNSETHMYASILRHQGKTYRCGFHEDEKELNPKMFPFQKFIVRLALKKGRYAIFADCGLGKTLMQIEWINQVFKFTGKPVIILAPLAVSSQTIKEGLKFGIDIKKLVSDALEKTINITNYEQLEKYDVSDVDASDVLSVKEAKAEHDEKHMTPTQKEPIKRLYELYSNPGDLIFSPFNGIGTEGYVAIENNRKYIGVELKESYFDLSIKNLTNAELKKKQVTLFDLAI